MPTDVQSKEDSPTTTPNHKRDQSPEEQKALYWTELATAEKALLAYEPTGRMVPTTITKMTARITAYSAMS